MSKLEQGGKEWLESKKKKFLEQIVINSQGCWIWNGSKAKDGYGIFYSKEYLRAHRASYLLFVAQIPKGLWVLHKCDVPLCVNPKHLYLGDCKQNVKDAIERGRFPKGPNLKKSLKGEKNPKSKLTEENVKEIKKLSHSFTKSQLAEKYGVLKGTIIHITKGRTWKHI